MDRIGDMPSHPLLVHVPVVLVPVALIALVALVVRPRWQRPFGPVVAIVAFVGFLGALLATHSGEALEEQFESTGMDLTRAIHDHAEMGDQVPWFVGVFFVLVLAWVLVARRRARGDAEAPSIPKAVVAALLALSVVAGVVATVSVVRTGHSGASSVWEEDEEP
ncbi:MAG: DUF2231 domain-containing protein [Acidimicrobiales bacterium]